MPLTVTYMPAMQMNRPANIVKIASADWNHFRLQVEKPYS